jgi:hypothetical protein
MTLIGQPNEFLIKTSYLDQLGFFLHFHQCQEWGQGRQPDWIQIQIPGRA